MTAKVHVVGAGLAGLAAAVRLAKNGWQVSLSDSAAQAGGRCRSYFDATLNCEIDNGNHLVLSGNHAVHAYLQAIGAREALAGPEHAEFFFTDLRDGARWALHPNDGPLPWWIFSKSRRVPGSRLTDYLAYRRLLSPPQDAPIGKIAPCSGPLWERLMNPLLTSVLNTDPASASATLAARVLKETLLKGGKAYAPRIAQPTLAAAFVNPAIQLLAQKGFSLKTGRRLRRLIQTDGRISALEFSDGTDEVAARDKVILATPAWVTGELVPGLTVPDAFRAIVNAHFAVNPPHNVPHMTGVIGGTAEWVFCFPGRISVTVSAAERIVDAPREELATRIWADVCKVLNLPPRLAETLPPWQIVKEKRATFAATPAQDARRPDTRTHITNLYLAGDWTATGLPATIEGALRSGQKAAVAVTVSS